MSERTPSGSEQPAPALDEPGAAGNTANGSVASDPDPVKTAESAEPADPAGAADPAGPADPAGAADPAGPAETAPAGSDALGAPTGDTDGDRAGGPRTALDGESGSETDGDGDGHGAKVRHWREQSRKRNEKRKRPWWIELPILIVIAFVLTFLIQTFIARVYYVPSGSMEQTLHGTTSGGDRILAFKVVYDFRDPEQGEVVVFKGPDTWAPEANIPGPSSWFGKAAQAVGSVVGIAPPNEKDFVKRVIAVGGQTVSCCDRKGRVQVDGHPLNEPYIYQPIDADLWARPGFHCQVDPDDPTRYNSRRCFAPVTVPKGELWMMGDHRSDSSDSSYYCLGMTEQGMKQYRQVRADHASCGRPIPVDDVIGKAVFIVMPPSRWGTVGSPDIMSGSS